MNSPYFDILTTFEHDWLFTPIEGNPWYFAFLFSVCSLITAPVYFVIAAYITRLQLSVGPMFTMPRIPILGR